MAEPDPLSDEFDLSLPPGDGGPEDEPAQEPFDDGLVPHVTDERVGLDTASGPDEEIGHDLVEFENSAIDGDLEPALDLAVGDDIVESAPEYGWTADNEAPVGEEFDPDLEEHDSPAASDDGLDGFDDQADDVVPLPPMRQPFGDDIDEDVEGPGT